MLLLMRDSLSGPAELQREEQHLREALAFGCSVEN